MKIEAIPNKIQASMGAEFERSSEWAKQIDIASAFVTSASLKRLKRVLENAKIEKRPLEIRLVFGLYQRFTSPDALYKMLRLQRDYPGQFFVRIARNARFHWKLYLFSLGNSRRLYVGSANLTEDGLYASGEMSVKITAKSSDSIVQVMQSEFDDLWQNGSFLLNTEIWEKYRKVKRPPVFVTASKQDATNDGPISKLLESAERPPKVLTPSKPRLISLNAETSQKTEDIIRTQKGWQAKGWNYVCFGYRHSYESAMNAKVILLVDHRYTKEPSFEFEMVEEATELETPDGKYFIAYSRVPHGMCREYGTMKGKLIQVGLTPKRLESDRNLSAKQISILCRLLRVRPEKLALPSD